MRIEYCEYMVLNSRGFQKYVAPSWTVRVLQYVLFAVVI